MKNRAVVAATAAALTVGGATYVVASPDPTDALASYADLGDVPDRKVTEAIPSTLDVLDVRHFGAEVLAVGTATNGVGEPRRVVTLFAQTTDGEWYPSASWDLPVTGEVAPRPFVLADGTTVLVAFDRDGVATMEVAP